MDALYRTLHHVLVAAYLLAPPAVVVGAFVLARRGRRRGVRHAGLRHGLPAGSTLLAGAAIGMALALVYAQLIAGSLRAVSLGQVALAAYAGMGLLALVKGFDWLLRAALAGVRRWRGWNGRSAVAVAQFARVLVLVLVMLPFTMAAAMTFRPKVVPAVNPMSAGAMPFERVEFTAADGMRLVGWWLPAPPLPTPNPRGEPEDGILRIANAPQSARRAPPAMSQQFPLQPPRWPSDQTVILVHGLGSGKADVLPLAAQVRAAGYNVLLFDLRAHGESGGQFSSFGALERRDVEAAAAWARATKPDACDRLLGLGASMGAAAMLAARDAQTGRTPFDAIAVIGTYDDLGRMADEVIHRQFWGPLGTIARWTALPAASAHAGCDLARFRPAEAIAGCWPVPVLVAHGQADSTIPYAAGRRLYDAALEPRRAWWVPRAGHNDVLADPRVLRAVLSFFEQAEQAPREGVV